MDENPSLFTYLFNINRSTLAKLFTKYNREFHEELKKYIEFCQRIKDTEMEIRCEMAFNKINIDGEGFIDINSEQNFIRPKEEIGEEYEWVRKLPILGIMIFEIHLFEEQHQWLNLEEHKTFRNCLAFCKIVL